MEKKRERYVLGLDMGSASLGWAVVALGADGKTRELLRAGVRVFDPGVAGSQLDIVKGQNQSKAVDRRMKRLQRRQLRRRAARQRELFELLQEHGLLPAYTEHQAQKIASEKKHISARSEARHEILNELDRRLLEKWRARMTSGTSAVAAGEHVLPYYLRARALGERLEPEEVGRALYNLGQRRGFKSNKKATANTSDQRKKQGEVDKGIGDLGKAIEAAGARTLGEYFAGVDPTDPGQKRIRDRYTHRKMFEAEFDAIWASQETHKPGVLNADLKEKIRHLLFFQRPIARQEHLIGRCELEAGQKRAPMAYLEAQRFRLLQKVNDLLAAPPGEPERALSAGERKRLVDDLEREGDLTFEEVRKLLELKEGTQFNLERGGEKRLPGNRTARQMRAVFGQRWEEFSETERSEVIEEWRIAENEEELKRRAQDHWGLNENKAGQWAKKHAEAGYARVSLAALQKLLPLLENGKRYQTAVDELYEVRFSGGSVYVQLPPVWKAIPELRNPAVERALTELRKVVNAIVRDYGKPYEIHIELARELKLALRDREARGKKFRENEDRRKAVKEKILKECGLASPSEDAIKKALLWEECQEICPYTGRVINFCDLFGEHPQFDIEHILPKSRVADNSMGNLTLCEMAENRQRKGGQTPWEAYGGSEDWEKILARVERMNNPAKLKRFQVRTKEELEEFQARRLNDTAYASTLAAKYLGLLYGGRDVERPDGTRRQVIRSSSGGVTADLGWGWGLKEILRELAPDGRGDGRGKLRDDHRHHAIDALVIALTTPGWVQTLSDTAARNLRERGRESYRGLPLPWDNFVGSVRAHIEGMKVSHRPEHGLSGSLHADTHYSPQLEATEKDVVHSRRPVEALSKSDIEAEDVIVDKAVRHAVQKRFAEVGRDPKKLKGEAGPFLETRDGRKIPIRSVRIRESLKTVAIGRLGESPQAPAQRHVALKNNHHTEIVALLDKSGKEVEWEGFPVSLLEAAQRAKQKKPIIKRNHGAGCEFKFSLAVRDLLEITRDAEPELWLVRSITSQGQIYLSRHTDARLSGQIKGQSSSAVNTTSVVGSRRKPRKKGTGDWWTPGADKLFRSRARKIVVDVLGKVHPAND